MEEGGGWERAAPYAVRYLGEHFLSGKPSGLHLADYAERMVAFCTDPGWLKRVVPLIGIEEVINLVKRTHQVTADEDLKILARVLRRSRVAVSQDVNQLAAQLHVRLAGTNLPRLGHLISKLGLLAPTIWLRSRGKLLGWEDDLATQYTVVGTVRALAFGEVKGTTILGIGLEGRVILWDPRRGVGEERTIYNPEGRVTALSIEYLDGDPVLVVAAGYDGTIVIRDYWTGEQVGPAYMGAYLVDSVTAGFVGGRRMVVAIKADQNRASRVYGNLQCWMWDQQTGILLDEVPKVEAGWSVAGVLSVDGRVTLSLFRIDRADDSRMVWFHTSLVEVGTGVPIWPVRQQQHEPTLIATSVLSRGPVSAAVLAVGEDCMNLQAWSPATTDQHQVVGEGLWRVQERVGTLSVGEIDGRVVAAYAPVYDGSGFVRLVGLESDPEYVWENYVPPSYDPRAVYLSQFEIWSALESGSDAVQVLGVEVLQGGPRLKLVEIKSGFDWGLPADASLTPEVVSQAVGGKISVAQSVSAFFSVRDDEAIPILLDTVENATKQVPSLLRLRRADPGGWPATTTSRGFLNGRAVLVCGSYRGVVWVWDLETEEVLAGPFADIPDDFEFHPHKKSSFNNAVTTDVAMGELDGEAVIAAAVAG